MGAWGGTAVTVTSRATGVIIGKSQAPYRRNSRDAVVKWNAKANRTLPRQIFPGRETSGAPLHGCIRGLQTA